MKTYDTNKLINDFIENAIIQGEATYTGEYKKGNKASAKRFKIYKVMDNEIEIAKQMLDILLEHENINVQIWAAEKALDLNYKEHQAEERLLAISKMPGAGILGLNAELSLKARKISID
ncbi:DUF2019 domain-containing protein [Clostridium aminobutyricum]|uniref:DUF2019 domain-containing protein n=1 Tax=Clostridium aminobutyricum TaxID=33953 RepID=A0A939IJL6_CLOAM|nr:DUF2019 domain-containing protein [Clostridium aminobutyricum]MBN7773728.1 DUF2019 domain-containing protein [Clostridium aminobutyricum]